MIAADRLLWYFRAAEDGNEAVSYSLGIMYQKRVDVPKEYRLAAQWIDKALKQGHTIGRERLEHLQTRGQ